MTTHWIIETTDPDFPKHVEMYMDRLAEVVETGKTTLIEEGNLGLLWHKAVPDLPKPMSCPNLELVPAIHVGGGLG